jgi:CBS domain-containing protein
MENDPMRTTFELEEIGPAVLDESVAARLAVPPRRTCSPFSTVTEAVLIFRDEDCDIVAVVDQGKPVGYVRVRDVALAVASTPSLGEQPVSRIMTRDIITVPGDLPYRQIVRTIISTGASMLFVVDASGILVGLLSWSDLATRLSVAAMTRLFEPTDEAEVK